MVATATKQQQQPAPKRKISLFDVFSRDGWANIITGIGTKKDKIQFSEILWMPTTRARAEQLFAADDMAGKIAQLIPFDGTRAGVTFEIQDGAKDELVPWINEEYERLNAWRKLAWAWSMSRANGGALVIISADDGRQMWEPLNVNGIRSIRALNVIDRWELFYTSTDLIADPTNPYFGTPEWYTYQPQFADASSTPTSKLDQTSGSMLDRKIHHSRVIRFDGVRLPNRLFVSNNYWHDSIYTRLYEPLRNYTMAHNSVATVLQEFNQPVFRIEGLSAALANDQDTLILKKLQQVNIARSVARAAVLDKEDEFDNVTVNLSGIKDLLDATEKRLCAASNIPHTRLFGESPSGLGATGQSEMNDYYDFVSASQELDLRKPLQYLTTLLFMQKTAAFPVPKKWTFKFNPLRQIDDKTLLETRKIQADIDDVYMRNGVYDSFEVATSRFGTGKFSYETSLEESLDKDEHDARTQEELANAAGTDEKTSTKPDEENQQAEPA